MRVMKETKENGGEHRVKVFRGGHKESDVEDPLDELAEIAKDKRPPPENWVQGMELSEITFIAAMSSEEAFAKLVHKLKTLDFEVSVDKKTFSLSFKQEVDPNEEKLEQSALIDAVLYQPEEDSTLYVAELIFADGDISSYKDAIRHFKSEH
jgi:hypothetical protein